MIIRGIAGHFMPKKKKLTNKDYHPHFLEWEKTLEVQFTFEYHFNKPRTNHRFDAAILCCKIAIEIEGGAFAGQGHRNVGKFLSDMLKYNIASTLGWRVFRFTTTDILKESFINTLTDYFANYPCTHTPEQQELWAYLRKSPK